MTNAQVTTAINALVEWDRQVTAFCALALEVLVFDPARTMIEVANNKIKQLNTRYDDWKPLEN